MPHTLPALVRTPLEKALRNGAVNVARHLLERADSAALVQAAPLRLHDCVLSGNIECLLVALQDCRKRGALAMQTALTAKVCLCASLCSVLAARRNDSLTPFAFIIQDADGFGVAYHACTNTEPTCLAHLLDAAEWLAEQLGQRPSAADGSAASSTGSPVRARDAPCLCTAGGDACGRLSGEMLGSFAAPTDSTIHWTCVNAAAYCGAAECLKLLLKRTCHYYVDARFVPFSVHGTAPKVTRLTLLPACSRAHTCTQGCCICLHSVAQLGAIGSRRVRAHATRGRRRCFGAERVL